MSQAGVTEEMREQIDVTRAEKRHAGGGRETREEGDVRRGSCGRRERWEEEEDKSWLSPSPAAAAAAKLLQSCPTLCDPIDGSPPGSPVPGMLQARTLEWVAISFSNA